MTDFDLPSLQGDEHAFLGPDGPGSPIGSEVKIELATNEVVWLSAADGGGTFSDNWTGAMVSPGVGVIVQELRPLICAPEK